MVTNEAQPLVGYEAEYLGGYEAPCGGGLVYKKDNHGIQELIIDDEYWP